MADEQIIAPEKTDESKPVITSAGKPTAVRQNFNSSEEKEIETPEPTNGTPPDGAKAKEGDALVIDDNDIPEDKLKAYFEKQGIKYEGIEKLKEKANAEPEKVLTDEEKAAVEKADEKRILDFYITNGGTPESFVGLKQILEADLTELSVAQIKGDMKKEGFDDEEIDAVLKERYYQIEMEEVEQGLEESDEDFEVRKKGLEKKIALGAKKLADRGSNIKKEAEKVINGLKDAIKSEDFSKEEEKQLLAKVDSALESLPKKMTFQLGKVNEQDIDPVEYEVSQESIDKVSTLLKNREQRNNLLFNQDDSLNITKLAEILVRNEELEKVAKVALLEGQSRQVKEFEKVFPKNPHQLGVGGSNGAAKAPGDGKIASRGKPERVKQGVRS